MLKRIINRFDARGNIVLQEIYDANGEQRYSIKKNYEDGLLISESDPMGDERYYSYDSNQNLTTEQSLASGITFEYGYDLQNRLISTTQHGSLGEKRITHSSYDMVGNKISDMDHFGNQTSYSYDALGRISSISYPKKNTEEEHLVLANNHTYM